MACNDNSCGTGLDRTISQPGDPDLNASAITALNALDGISINWQYPKVNPEGLSHTEVYRSRQQDPEMATVIAVVSGNSHFDRNDFLEEGIKYYYWIKMYSVNGTEGDFVGPANATSQPTSAELQEILKGKLTEAALASDLLSSIGDIALLKDALDKEVGDRSDEDSALSQLLASLQESLDTVDTLLTEEIQTRITNDSALLNKLNVTLAKANNNTAAIINEQEVRAEENSALAGTLETIVAENNDQFAAIQELRQVNTELGAEWILKTDVNGRVSGIALRNDGNESSFIINADTFGMVVKGDDGEVVSPFVVSEVNGEYLISLNSRVLIGDGDITNLMIGNVIQSNDFDPYKKTGWRLDKEAGLVVYSGGYFQGDINAFNGTFRGEIHADGDSTFKGDVEATSLVANDFIRIGATTPLGWETIDTFFKQSNSRYDVSDGQTKLVLSLPVTVTDASHRVFLDWGLQVLTSDSGNWGWTISVRFYRNGVRLFKDNSTVAAYRNSPLVRTTQGKTLEDTGATVLLTMPGFGPYSSRRGDRSKSTAEAEAVGDVRGMVANILPPYGGSPHLETTYEGTTTSGTPRNTRTTHWYSCNCDKFAVPVGNLFSARGIHSQYKEEWLAQTQLSEDTPGVGTHTYKIELYVSDLSTTAYTYASDRFIKAVIQKPIYDD